MNNQIVHRGGAIGGAIGVVEAVRRAYNHRAEIQEAANVVRQGAARANAYWNNRGLYEATPERGTPKRQAMFRPSSKSSRSSRSSRFAKRGYKKRGYKKRGYKKRGFKKRNYKKRNYRGRSKGITLKTLESFWPWQEKDALLGEILTCASGSSANTSMECGTYSNGVIAGSTLGTQSAFAVKTATSSDIDQMLPAGANRLKGFIECEQCDLGVEISNAGNSPAIVKIYDCKWRKDESSDSLQRMYQKYAAALTTDGLVETHDMTPFKSQAFTSRVKILASRTIRLGQGEQTTHRIRSPIANGKSRHQNSLVESACTESWTRSIFIILTGVPIHTLGTELPTPLPIHVTSSIASLNMIWRQKIKWRLLAGAATTLTQTNNLDTTAIATNMEIAPGNANDPTTIKT